MKEMTNSLPLVNVIILNYNGKEHLEYCLPSVLETCYSKYEVILVDNNSSDSSVSYTKENYPAIKMVKNERNLGWSGGNNSGIKYALKRGAKYIALLNNDIKVDKRWLTEAVKLAEDKREIGIVGFKVFGEYKTEDENGKEFERAKASWHRLEVEEAAHISGCALFIKADVFKDVGLIDEGYFIYGEEDDFEARALRTGYRMVRINIPIWHHPHGTFRKLRWKPAQMVIRNSIRFYIKNGDVGDVFWGILRVINLSCNPFLKLEMAYAHHRRMRPSNPFLNSFFVFYALIWNILFLPKTLRTRISDNRKIAQARQKIEKNKQYP